VVVVTDIVNHGINEKEEGFYFVRCDNRKPDDIVKMVQRVENRFTRIDILVNNAGILFEKPAVEIEADEWEEVFRINTTGTFLVSREVGKVMLRQKKGRIINIGSQLGSFGAAKLLAYCCSKAAVIHMSRALALEWAKEGIRVNTISPASTRTDMSKDRLTDPKLRAQYKYNYPVGRVLETDDLVGAVVFLASDSAEMVTGHNLNVDGGYLSQ